MIILPEQFGYNKDPEHLKDFIDQTNKLDKIDYYKLIINNKNKNKSYCFKINYLGDDENSNKKFHFETSYFVGVDWIEINKVSIYVKPKLDNETKEVDYLKMLFEALKAPENLNHLDGLFEVDFNKPIIPLESKNDILTPLLIIEYISILKKIVQKGLKKSYYTVTKNLNSKIKGKILVNDTIKKNHSNNKILYNYCQYSEFGINSTENKVLKKALSFSISIIQNFKKIYEVKNDKNNKDTFRDILNYIQPAFEMVDNEVNIDELKYFKPNSFYKEYEQALKLAKIILKHFGYNISLTSTQKISTPPFWIDMSKLFELYVFSKLNEKFPNEVIYHKKFNYQEPDFLISTNDKKFQLIVDAKYKPQYNDKNIVTNDIRQISGYARLNKIYDELKLEKDKVIDCLIIYSSQDAKIDNFNEDNFNFKANEEDEYNRIYKIGISLPIK